MKKIFLSFLYFYCVATQTMEMILQDSALEFTCDAVSYMQVQEIMSQHALSLLDGSCSLAHFDIKPRLISFMKMVRPLITIPGRSDIVSNEIKKQCRMRGIRPKYADTLEIKKALEGHEDKDELRFIQVQLGNDFKFAPRASSEIVSISYNGVETKKTIKGIIFNCVAINKHTKCVYAGASDGKIYVFTPDNEEKGLMGHKSAVNAIMFYNKNKFMISRSDDGQVLIWHVEDTKPRISLGNLHHYGTDYIFNHAIVRSHADKSKISSFLDADIIYEIPQGWVTPQFFSEDDAKLAFLFLLYELYYCKTFGAYIFNKLYNAPVINTFEPLITEAFKKFIEKKALEYNVLLEDQIFC